MNKTNITVLTMIVALAMIGTLGMASAAPYDSSVTLENKNPSTWVAIDDTISATVQYSSIGEEFAWHVSGNTGVAGTDYSLIYYADPWPGDNPGALIGTFTTNEDGDFENLGYTDLNMNLPHPDDYNANPDPDYCNMNNGFDNYEHCSGAKLWIVPSSDYSGTALTGWAPTNYLFETDLITYTVCGDYPGAEDIDDAIFSIGDVFDYDVASVPIMVLDATNAGAVDITLAYNASVLEFASIENGNMDAIFSNDGVGQVRIGTYQTGSPGMNGDFTLADVSFNAIGEGPCDFVITVTTFKDATPCGATMPYDMDIGICCPNKNGDVNGDGDVDMFDVMYIAKYKLGITGFGDICECAADVDGTAPIDLADASYLARHILGMTGYEVLN